MERLEKFDYLISIINEWIDKTPNEGGGAFRCMREGTKVRNIIVANRYKISVETFERYFTGEILDACPQKKYDSCSDIRRALTGELKKGAVYRFDELDNCFSPEKNQKAVEEIHLLTESKEMAEVIENWDKFPLYLLNRIRKIFREKIGEYWKACDEMLHLDPDDEKIEKSRKDRSGLYRDCAITLALHEIFVREFSKNWSILMEESKHHEAIFSQWENIEEFLSRANRTETEKLSQESREHIEWLEKFLILQFSCLEHNVSLEAEIQLMMLLEMKKVEILRKNRVLDDRKETRKTGEEQKEILLRFLEDRYLDDVEEYYKNKAKYYKRLEAMIQAPFIKYMEAVGLSEGKDVSVEKAAISNAIREYFKIIEQGKLNEKEREKLWSAECIMIRPVLMNEREA